ncbi:polyphosphate--glucose phosphotransferase [Actinomadura rugatobispora]|uniref:Polyphosphate--glucose phosphotransferase n=1 Tax=Actinomadura rugatobispora TaxID=1994 RepID=A0ABW0ZPU7_9ACTN
MSTITDVPVLGIDIGGSGIKGAPVDPATGALTTERLRIDTPRHAHPEPVAEVVGQIVRNFGWTGPVGVTFPGVVVDGETRSAANVSKKWIGLDAGTLFRDATGVPVTLLNDADAAGIAEMGHGAGKGRGGTVVVLTLGTGIGSALFTEGVLVPNTEFGHLEIRGKDGEARAAARVRTDHGLSWEKWAAKLSEYLSRMEALIAPSLIIVGGGVSRKADRFLPLISGVRAPIVPAALVNNAGIVGAAMAAGAAAGAGDESDERVPGPRGRAGGPTGPPAGRREARRRQDGPVLAGSRARLGLPARPARDE